MAHTAPPEEFYDIVEKRLKDFKLEPTAVNTAIQMWLATDPEMNFTRKLNEQPDTERVVRVMLELCDHLYANQGMRSWYNDLGRIMFFAEVSARPEEPGPAGVIIHDEGPEPDWVEYSEEGD